MIINDLMNLKASADYFLNDANKIDPRFSDGVLKIKEVPEVRNGVPTGRDITLFFPVQRDKKCPNIHLDFDYFKIWRRTIKPLADLARHAIGNEYAMVEFAILQCAVNDVPLKETWYHTQVKLTYSMIAHGMVVMQSTAQVDTSSRLASK